MPTQPAAPSSVTVVHAPACHFCSDAEEALAVVAVRFPLDIRRIELDSPDGRRLVAEHRPAMSPLVLLDGAFFSSGRLPRKKLVRELELRAARRLAGTA
ncbi:glutaredoxin [Sanguibacter sp. 25GB23B1]|uniref:glutaredoxin n=1 Tax=unclassified Sanguibacter TaxID=2645534 RepID=UPI0032AFB10B